MIDKYLRPFVQRVFDKLSLPLIALKVHPITITLTAFAVGIAASFFVASGSYSGRMTALILGAFSALLDILDGTVARQTNKESQLGTFLDLLCDRIVECFFIMMMAYVYPHLAMAAMIFLSMVVINFSSFLLAAQLFVNTGEKSIHYDVGILERTETCLFFGAMLSLPYAAGSLLWILNGLMILTATLRIVRIVRFACLNDSSWK